MSKRTFVRYYVLPILFLLSTATASKEQNPSDPQRASPNCETGGEAAQSFIARALRQSEKRFKVEKRPVFFLGFAVKIEEREQRQISHALMLPEDQLGDALESIFMAVGERLAQDREQLREWLQLHQLTSEVEILQQPTDGRFLLLQATRQGYSRILCAALTGDLPEVFTQLGP